jgi:DNA primase
MKLSQALLEEIKYRNPIDDVISSYVTSKKSGSSLTGLCPFHSEKTPSFSVSTKNQLFYCFGCGAGGDAITFLMKAENLDYMGAVRALAKRASITLPLDVGQKEEGVKRSRILDMNRDAAKFFNASLACAPDAQAYFQKRALPPALISHFGLGYAPGGYALVKHLRQLGYTDEEMIVGCLARRSEKNGQLYDFFSRRVMFPIIDVVGNVIAFGGRVLDDSLPKYLNSPDTPAFHKRHNLFALNFAKKHCADSFILCEGYMDVIALHGAGFSNAVATLGTAITPEQARLMRRYAPLVYICYDSDDAGKRATEKAIALLTQADVEVRVLHIQGAKDPDELIRKRGKEAFDLVLQRGKPQFDFKLDAALSRYDLFNPEEKVKAARAACEILSDIASPVEREVYLPRCAKRLDISPESLQQDVDRLIRKKRAQAKKDNFSQIAKTAQGFGDRINPQRTENLRASAAEEAILGMLLLYPEYAAQIAKGKIDLQESDFMTDFHRRIFTEIMQQCENGAAFDFGYLGDSFSPDEIGRITRLSMKRSSLSQNNENVLNDCITALKKEKEASQTDILTILQRKKDHEK